MEISTKRLKIYPLNFSLLSIYLANNHSFEDFLGINRLKYEIHEELLKPLNLIKTKLLIDNPNYWYQSLWVMIDEEKKQFVGSFMLKGKLKATKEIEIGYGTELEFQNQGYMTEAIGGLISGLKQIDFCKAILAETLAENEASHLVLIKNNFERIKTKKENLWWRRKLNN